MPLNTPSSTPSDVQDVVIQLRRRAAPALARRIGLPHATVILALRAMQPPEADAHSLYRALLDSGQEMPLSKLYRALKVLETAGMIHREWVAHDGRARSVYSAADRDRAVPDPAAGVCAHCGAALPGGTAS